MGRLVVGKETSTNSWLWWAIIGTAVLGGLNNGFNTALVNGLVPRIDSRLGLSDLEEGVLASSLFVGAVVGCLVAGFYMNDTLGRKKTTVIGETIIVAGTVGQVAYLNLWSISVLRIISGFGIGICTVTKPLYIAELSPSSHRGRAVGTFSVAFSLGYQLVFLCESLLPDAKDTRPDFIHQESWRLEIAFSALPALGLLIAVLTVLPESPVWLALQKQKASLAVSSNEKDRESLVPGSETCRESLAPGSKAQASGDLSSRRSSAACSAYSITAVLAVGHQLTLMAIMMTFTRSFIERLGVPQDLSQECSHAVAGTHLLGVLAAIPVVDLLGRRALLFFGCGTMLVSQLCTIILDLDDVGLGEESLWGLRLAFLCVYVFGYQIGLSSTYYVLISEIFPVHVRAQGNATGSVMLYFWATIVTSLYPAVEEPISIAALLGFSEAVLVCVIFGIYMYLPESTGVPLDQVTDMWVTFMSGKPFQKRG